MQQPAATAKNHFVVLDGLRGIAAIAVALLHICVFFRIGYSPRYAHLAVDFFFLLSGFVIAHAYDHKLANGMSWTEFLKIRMIRLYPLILVGNALGAAVFLANWALFREVTLIAITIAFASGLLLLPTSVMLQLRPWGFPLNGPLWSLSFEMAINIAYALAFRFLSLNRLFIIAALGAAALIFEAAIHNGLDFGFRWDELHLGFVRVLFPFTAGIIIRRSRSSTTSRSAFSYFVFPIFLAILLCPVDLGWQFEITVSLLLFPAMLILVTGLEGTPVIRNIWRSLGQLSYPLYVTHYPFVVAVSNLAKKMQVSGEQNLVMAVLCFVFILAFATLINRFYDVPIRAAISRIPQQHRVTL